MFGGHGNFASPLQQQQAGQAGNTANNTNNNATNNNINGGFGGMQMPGPGGFNLQQMMAMGAANGINLNSLLGNGGIDLSGNGNNNNPQSMSMANMTGQIGQQQQQPQMGFQGQPQQQDGQSAGGIGTMNGMTNNFIFNPQLQALLQQQGQQNPAGQQAQVQQPNMVGGQNQGQPNMQWLGMSGSMPQQQANLQQLLMNQAGMGQGFNPQTANGGNMGMQRSMNATGAGPSTPGSQQAFNPFMQQQQGGQNMPGQQQQQPSQQQNFGGPQQQNAFMAPKFLNAMQQLQQQSQRPGGQQQPAQAQAMAAALQSMNLDPASFMAATAQASGGSIDPNIFLQNPGLLASLPGFGGNLANGTIPNLPQQSPMPSSQNMQQQQQAAPTPAQAHTPQNSVKQSPRPPSRAAGLNTPETKAKGRPKGSTKKKKEEEQRIAQQQQQQQQQQQTSNQMQQPPTPAQPSFGQNAAPSPAQSFFQTPTQSHASIPMASPAQAFAQQQERARSHTRSPSISGAAPMGTPGASVRSFSGSIPSGQPNPAQNAPAGWTPSLTPQQQQHLLGQALSSSKAQSNIPGQSQPTPSPAQMLMQLGYVYVKANVLPNNGFGAGIPGNGPSGPGAVLSIDEARTIGIFGPQQPGVHQPMQQQRPPMPAALQNPTNAAQLMQQAHSAAMAGPSARPPLGPGSQQQQNMQPSMMAALTAGNAQQAGYRASPLGMAGSPPPSSSIPPSSPAQGMGSPAVRANARQRQASTSSRPASSAGRKVGGTMAAPSTNATSAASISAANDAQAAAASYAPFAQPIQAGGMIHSRSGSVTQIPATAGQGPLGGSLSGLIPTHQGSAPIPNNSHLPPVNGGPLPKTSKLGFDIAPEFNTRLTPLPSTDALTPDGKKRALSEAWKPPTKEEEKEMMEIMAKDDAYTKKLTLQGGRAQAILNRRIHEMRPIGRLHWWERSMDEEAGHLAIPGPFEHFKILLPGDKHNQRAAKGLRSALNGGYSSRQLRSERKAAAQVDEDLVPIRLEIDHEGWKLRDTFTWPAPESYKGELLERFAITLCEDFGLPIVHFAQAIREAIIAQVQDHTSAEALRPLPSKRKRDEMIGKGRLSQEEIRWWKKWRRDLEIQCEQGRIQELEDDPKASEDEKSTEVSNGGTVSFAEVNGKPAEMRIQIKLDITVGAMNLVDQFEWDVSDDGSSAEDFASTFAADLGLSGEFKTAIAHSIREQVDVYTRSLSLVGYTFDGSDVLDEELRGALLAPVSSIVRFEHDVDAHTPKLMQLSELEIMQMEKEREREARRKRRQTRGRRGVNLPDREPLKTARTPAVHGLQQFTNAGADAGIGGGEISSGRGAGLDHSSRSLAGMSTRRAAAVLASANIANANASGDYGTPTPQPEDIMRNGAGSAINQFDHRKEAAKKRKLDIQATHFEYPGGLGKIDDEADDDRDQGPKFAPFSSDSPSKNDARSNEGGGIQSNVSRMARHALGHGHGTSSPSASIAWNMARPEEALNQVTNWHDGMWFCSNCGVPGNMDPTRRKGPLGDKSLCGMCGKYFHRHRKARPVEYTRSVKYHLKQLQARGIMPNMVEVEDMLAKESASKGQVRGTESIQEASFNNVSGPNAQQASSDIGTNAEMTTTTDSIMAYSSYSDDAAGAANGTAEGSKAGSGQAAAAGTGGAAAAAPPPLPNSDDNPSDVTMQPVDRSTVPSSADNLVNQPQVPTSLGTSTNVLAAKVEEKAAPPSFPTTRGNSPDLPFEQVGSPDDSDSSEDEKESKSKTESHQNFQNNSVSGRSVSPNKAIQQPNSIPMTSSSSIMSAGQAGSPPMLPRTTSAQSPGSSSSGVGMNASQPEWLSEASHALRIKYPLDRFEVLARPRGAGAVSSAPEWRLRCQDCPGKLYTPGPEQSLTNFEIHLRNRAHRANVAKAVQQEGRKPYSG
ncbi:hypothetical protein L7F22_039170 [Adiantum nelumboides]|nr:hypothetical protein [Adiantum nelumboides]